jgi:hypothetical protein
MSRLEAQNKRDVNRYLIGLFSLTPAFCSWLIGGTHFLMPKAQIHFATGIKPDFFTSLASGSTAFRVHCWVYAVLAVFGMGVVLRLRSLLSSRPNLWLRLTEVFALIGLGVLAIDFIMMQNTALRLAREWPSLDTTARALGWDIPGRSLGPVFETKRRRLTFQLIKNILPSDQTR